MNTEKKDEMTPKERMTAFAEGKEIDRIPVTAFIGEHSCRLAGVKVSDYHRSVDVMVEVEIKCFRKYRTDSSGVGPGLLGIPEAMGTKLSYPDYNSPYVEEPAIKDWSSFNLISKADPYKDGRLPLFLEALKKLEDEIGDEVSLGSFIGGPITMAAALRGTENFLRDLIKNKEMAHKLLQLVTESGICYIDAVSKLGYPVGIADPVASLSVISKGLFREFAYPYITQLVEHIIEKCGAPPMLHICGKTSMVWSDMVETGAGIISIDNIEDLAKAKEEIGKRVCLHGNIPPIDVFMKGSTLDVKEAVKDCLRKAYDSPGGYILAPGCALAIDTPFENVEALMDAARDYGKFPIQLEKLS